MKASFRSERRIHVSKKCIRPSWSDADNDPCPCDNDEAFDVLYDRNCEVCCSYFQEVYE